MLFKNVIYKSAKINGICPKLRLELRMKICIRWDLKCLKGHWTGPKPGRDSTRGSNVFLQLSFFELDWLQGWATSRMKSDISFQLVLLSRGKERKKVIFLLMSLSHSVSSSLQPSHTLTRMLWYTHADTLTHAPTQRCAPIPPKMCSYSFESYTPSYSIWFTHLHTFTHPSRRPHATTQPLTHTHSLTHTHTPPHTQVHT